MNGEKNHDDPELDSGQNTSPFELNRSKIRRAIHSQSLLSQPYFLMNALATIVASYGLLADSTAVVIGAMIIALLLGPIMGLALAMVDGDVQLLRRALTAELVGAAMVLAIGFVIGEIHYNLPITNEILSRTQPNILDLMIALAGGAAGAYATISPRVSAGLVGVAISTALVPPLASSGICLAHGLIPQAFGAFLLFATNLVAIQFSSSIVLLAFGFKKLTVRDPDEKGFWQRVAIDAVLIIALGIFLYFQLTNTVARRNYEEEVKNRLMAALKPIPGAFLAETRFVDQGDKQIIVAVVRAPNSLTPDQTAEIEKQLPFFKNHPNELHIRSLLTKETVSTGYLHEIDPEAQPIERIEDPSTKLIEEPENLLTNPEFDGTRQYTEGNLPERSEISPNQVSPIPGDEGTNPDSGETSTNKQGSSQYPELP